MRTDHRRPLVAYGLVTVVCAFVVAPSLDLGGFGVGQKPSISAFSDTTTTPSEGAGSIYEPPPFTTLPDADIVEQPTDAGDSLAPGIDAINGVLDEPVIHLGEAAVTSTATATASASGGSEPAPSGVDSLEAGLVVNGGREDTADAGAEGDADPGKGSDGVDGFAPSDGGPATSPGDGGGADSGPGSDAPAPENGNGHGHAAPAPHSFDHVPPGTHPYGHVGPPPGSGSKDHHQGGPKDKGPKDKGSRGKGSQGKGSHGKGPQGKAHHPGRGRSHR